MDQPAKDRLDDHEKRIKKLEEQQTEPMRIARVEIASADVERQLDNHTELLREISQKQDKFTADVEELKIDAKAYTGDAAIFKNKVERVESDVSTITSDVDTIKTVQNGHSKYFEEHGRRLSQMATKDDLTAMQGQIKEDTGTIETRLDRIEGLIMQLLQQKPPES